jgi:hypothetical protein
MSEEKGVLIGLVGYSQHGKSTVAQFLKKQNFIEYAFADPLKATVMGMFGFTYEQCYDQEYKNKVDPFWGISPRDALIKIGEHNAEKIKEILPAINLGNHNRLWVRKFEKEFINNNWINKKIVVSDIRHQSEADVIKKLGGYIIAVYNPHISMHEEYRKSESETRIDNIKFDNIIYNTSSLDKLNESTINILDNLHSINTSKLGEIKKQS